MPNNPPGSQKFDIPALSEATDDSLAVKEDIDFGEEFLLRSGKLEWWLRYVLKIILFLFVIGINVWWIAVVLSMVRRSGSDKSGFHLDDSVLIALVSTSIANFLALAIVVAKHLFPDSKSK